MRRGRRQAGAGRTGCADRAGGWTAPPPVTADAEAWQRPDGTVVVRAPDEAGLRARAVHARARRRHERVPRRFASDPLLGPSARALARLPAVAAATVAHATLRAIGGQLIESRRARAIERSSSRVRAAASRPSEALRASRPLDLRRDLAQHARLDARTYRAGVDLDRLASTPSDAVAARLARERGIGPWSIGVIALEGLGRYDHGLVGDLGLSSSRRRSGTLGRGGGDGRAARAVRRVAGARGRAAPARLVARARPRRRPDVARERRLRHAAEQRALYTPRMTVDRTTDRRARRRARSARR